MNDDAEDLGSSVVYVAYADLMHKLQVLELTLWESQATSLKAGMTTDQATAQVEKWDGTTFGKLWRGMRTQPHWPAGLVDDIDQLVELRNYLAHHFLREFFFVVPSKERNDSGIERLLNWHELVDALAEDLGDHVTSRMNAAPLDEETEKLLESLRPTSWPFAHADDREGSQTD